MKAGSTALLGAVLVLLHLLTGIALGGGYASWVSGGPNATSPHDDYSDSTTKCKVCHAVHNAGAGAQTLLRSTRSNACVYCHLNPGTVSSLRPYGQGAGALPRYVRTPSDSDVDYNHASWHYNSAPYSGCVSCHAVHGANTINGGDKILRNDPGKAISTPVTDEIGFCRDCHNRAGGNLLVGGCFRTCHTANPLLNANISPDYYAEARNGRTHVMTTTLTGNYGTQVAWSSSELCRSCHAAGQPYAEGDSFPHYTSGAAQFLSTDYPVADTGMDAVCLNCHAMGGDGDNYTTGVGKTF